MSQNPWNAVVTIGKDSVVPVRICSGRRLDEYIHCVEEIDEKARQFLLQKLSEPPDELSKELDLITAETDRQVDFEHLGEVYSIKYDLSMQSDFVKRLRELKTTGETLTDLKPTNGIEAVIYFALCRNQDIYGYMIFQQKHEASSPYDLEPTTKAEPGRPYYIFGTHGVLCCDRESQRHIRLIDWYREAILCQRLKQHRVFRGASIWSAFARWRKGVRWCKFERNKAQLEDRSLLTNPRYVCLLDRLHRFLDCLKVLRFLPTEAKVPLTVREFCDSVNHAAKFNSILLFEFLPVVSSVCQETRQRMRAEIQQLKESINILFGTVSKSTPLSELNTKQAQLQGRYARLCADFAAFPRLINRIKLEIVSCIWIAFNENVEEFVREKESDVAETPESIVARVLVRLVFQTGEQAHPTENARGKETRLRINPSPLLIKSLFSSAVQVLSSSTHLEELKRNFLLNQLSPEAIEEDSQRQTCRVSVESNIKLTDAETDMKTPEDSLIHSVPWNPAVPEGMDAEAEHIRGFLTEVIRSTERKPASTVESPTEPSNGISQRNSDLSQPRNQLVPWILPSHDFTLVVCNDEACNERVLFKCFFLPQGRVGIASKPREVPVFEDRQPCSRVSAKDIYERFLEPQLARLGTEVDALYCRLEWTHGVHETLTQLKQVDRKQETDLQKIQDLINKAIDWLGRLIETEPILPLKTTEKAPQVSLIGVLCGPMYRNWSALLTDELRRVLEKILVSLMEARSYLRQELQTHTEAICYRPTGLEEFVQLSQSVHKARTDEERLRNSVEQTRIQFEILRLIQRRLDAHLPQLCEYWPTEEVERDLLRAWREFKSAQQVATKKLEECKDDCISRSVCHLKEDFINAKKLMVQFAERKFLSPDEDPDKIQSELGEIFAGLDSLHMHVRQLLELQAEADSYDRLLNTQLMDSDPPRTRRSRVRIVDDQVHEQLEELAEYKQQVQTRLEAWNIFSAAAVLESKLMKSLLLEFEQ
ncbi:hypothetical protein CSKR_100168, partial [Clonorchis sinensis]